MARTITPGEALNIVAKRYGQIASKDSLGARFCDEVQAFMWNRYPWRESLEDFPPFHLNYDEPDYGPPLYAVPSDFLSVYEANIQDSEGGRPYPPLAVLKNLTVSGWSGVPQAISYRPETSSFRLHPRPSLTAPTNWVAGVYKKRPTKITNDTLNSYLLPWDDLYFPVFRRGLVWKIKDEVLGQDATDAFAQFLFQLHEMAVAEGIAAGVSVVAPAESLELGG